VFAEMSWRFRRPRAGRGVRGDLQLSMIRMSGAPVRDDEMLRVATSDYIATGGSERCRRTAAPADMAIPDDAPFSERSSSTGSANAAA
jgi:hypothetical protein